MLDEEREQPRKIRGVGRVHSLGKGRKGNGKSPPTWKIGSLVVLITTCKNGCESTSDGKFGMTFEGVKFTLQNLHNVCIVKT